MTQHIRLDKCSEARRRIRVGGYNAAHLGLAVDRMIAEQDDAKSHDGLLLRDVGPIAPECKASRVACGWTWFDWIIVGYMLLALTCEVMLAAQIMAGQVRWQTVVVAVLSVVGMFGFGVMRGGK